MVLDVILVRPTQFGGYSLLGSLSIGFTLGPFRALSKACVSFVVVSFRHGQRLNDKCLPQIFLRIKILPVTASLGDEFLMSVVHVAHSLGILRCNALFL